MLHKIHHVTSTAIELKVDLQDFKGNLAYVNGMQVSVLEIQHPSSYIYFPYQETEELQGTLLNTTISRSSVQEIKAVEQQVKLALQTCLVVSLVPRLLPYRQTGRKPGRSDHVPRDNPYVVLCVVLIIELLPTQSVLSVTNNTRTL